jgi:hypothetical protein
MSNSENTPSLSDKIEQEILYAWATEILNRACVPQVNGRNYYKEFIGSPEYQGGGGWQLLGEIIKQAFVKALPSDRPAIWWQSPNDQSVYNEQLAWMNGPFIDWFETYYTLYVSAVCGEELPEACEICNAAICPEGLLQLTFRFKKRDCPCPSYCLNLDLQTELSNLNFRTLLMYEFVCLVSRSDLYLSAVSEVENDFPGSEYCANNSCDPDVLSSQFATFKDVQAWTGGEGSSCGPGLTCAGDESD